MHNPYDKHPTRPGLEPSTSEFRVTTEWNESAGPAHGDEFWPMDLVRIVRNDIDLIFYMVFNIKCNIKGG